MYMYICTYTCVCMYMYKHTNEWVGTHAPQLRYLRSCTLLFNRQFDEATMNACICMHMYMHTHK